MSYNGSILKYERELSQLTQKELAEILNIKANTISQYESNQRRPSVDVLEKLADYFDVSIDYLMGRENK